MDIDAIPTLSLFGTIATIEASIEREDIKTAGDNLASWGITYEQGRDELYRRAGWPLPSNSPGSKMTKER